MTATVYERACSQDQPLRAEFEQLDLGAGPAISAEDRHSATVRSPELE